MTKPRPRLAFAKRYPIVSALIAFSLAPSGAFAATSSIILYDSGAQSETVVAGCDLPLQCERPRINDHGEIVWTERLDVEAGLYGIVSNVRGLMKSGHVTRDPEINNSGEVIWSFGDGSFGTVNGIESSVRGVVLSSIGTDLRFGGTHRINNHGEIIAIRSVGGFKIWSTVRGFVPTSSDILRATDVNDGGEIVYETEIGIDSTVRGPIAGSLSFRPDINNQGEVVWQHAVTLHGAPQFEIWSNLRGKIGDGENPSINDAGEVVWSRWDGHDWEIYSSIHGQLTSNDIGDDRPHINNSGDIVWLRDFTQFVPEPPTLAFVAMGLFLSFRRMRHPARLG